MRRPVVLLMGMFAAFLLASAHAAAALPSVTLVFDQNLTVSSGGYTRLTISQSYLDAGYTYTLTVRPILGEQSLYGDPYIYGIVYHTGSTTRRVRRVSRFSGDAVEQASMDKSLQDQGEDNAEFRIYCETSVSSCKVKATVHSRAPGGNDSRVFYTEGREPGVSDNQVYVDKDFYHPTEHTGNYGLQVLYEAGEYIYLYRDAGANASGLNSLSFWVRSSGSVDENDLSVVLSDASHYTLSPWRPLSNYVNIAQSHTWYKVVVPLADLGVTGGTFYGVAIKSSQAGVVYFDEVQLANVSLSQDLKLPLEAGEEWYLTVEVGGQTDCTNPGDDTFHYPNAAYYSLDFAPRTLSSGNGSTPLSDVPILAAGAGRVIEAPSSEHTFNGFYVRIDHDQPYDGSGLTSYYLHLKQSASSLLGQDVAQGKVLGHMGTTGQSTGVHLHFQLKHNGDSSSAASVLGGIRVEGLLMTEYQAGCRLDVPPTGFYPSTNVAK